MSRFIIAALAATSLGAAGTVARAAEPGQPGFYVGGVLTRTNYKESGFPSASPTALALQAGWAYNEYLAVEARLGTGIASDSLGFQGVDVDLKVDYYYSALLRATLPLRPDFNVYAVGGATEGKLKARALGVTSSDSDSAASFGAGLEYRFGPDTAMAVDLEYARLLSGDDYDLDGLSVGLRYRF